MTHPKDKATILYESLVKTRSLMYVDQLLSQEINDPVLHEKVIKVRDGLREVCKYLLSRIETR